MIKLLSYLIGNGVVTSRDICPPLEGGVRGLPALTDSSCAGSGCSACADVCPTSAIKVLSVDEAGSITLDLGMCIGCGLCVDICPSGTIVNDLSTKIATTSREALILSNEAQLVSTISGGDAQQHKIRPDRLFGKSVAARVVSTGCSGCDLELGAAGNPIFDIERFGVHIVASPRFADVLLVTGPVARGMQDALKSCYEAMSDPRKIIAIGTCAISGGVHRGGYAEGNGVTDLIVTSVFIPGCPPHPWSIVHGVLVAMGRAEPRIYQRRKVEMPSAVRTEATQRKALPGA